MKLGLHGLVCLVFCKIFSAVAEEATNSYTGAVVANGHECARIGSTILTKGGSAIDSAIATLFCEGLTMPQALGIGGGFIMTAYMRETKTVVTLNARETAPSRAHKDMFKGNVSTATNGGLSVGVPGEVRGYWEAHQRYGKLAWPELIEPTIKLCREGHLVTEFLEKRFKDLEGIIRNDTGLREAFINPLTDKPYKKGEYIKRPTLANTLEEIAKDGPDALYDGSLTKKFVEDIQKAGGIITVDDMKSYRPVWGDPLRAKLPHGQTLFTAPLPSSGSILIFILNILDGLLDTKDMDTLQNWQTIVEVFKYAFAKRTELADPHFVEEMEDLIHNLTSTEYANEIKSKITANQTFLDPMHYGAKFVLVEDPGTAHVSILAPNGDGVAVTSSISEYFGAGFVSPSTGIILNDAMVRFSSPNITLSGFPPHPNSYIAPGKRPIFSACPSIVIDENGDVVLVMGAAGHLKIISTTALVTMRHLWFNEPLAEAVAAPRLHHQLMPMKIRYEKEFKKDLIEGLHKIGHEVETLGSIGFSSLTAISTRDDTIKGSFDWRRQGNVCLLGNSHLDQKLTVYCKQ